MIEANEILEKKKTENLVSKDLSNVTLRVPNVRVINSNDIKDITDKRVKSASSGPGPVRASASK